MTEFEDVAVFFLKSQINATNWCGELYLSTNNLQSDARDMQSMETF